MGRGYARVWARCSTAEGVSRLGAAVEQGDWDAAASVQHALAASDWDECAQWLTAVKRLVRARQAGR